MLLLAAMSLCHTQQSPQKETIRPCRSCICQAAHQQACMLTPQAMSMIPCLCNGRSKVHVHLVDDARAWPPEADAIFGSCR